MTTDIRATARQLAASTLVAGTCLLAACGGGSAPSGPPPAVLTADAPSSGNTPFLATINLRGVRLSGTQSVSFTIASQPGTVSKPVNVTYSINYLINHGDTSSGATSIRVPIFGLYADKANLVTLQAVYADGSSETTQSTIQTSPYNSAINQYQSVTPIVSRAASASLGYDFLYIKSQLEGPVVMDTDGILRWVGSSQAPTPAMLWTGEEFYSGETDSSSILTTQPDGSVTALASLSLSQPVIGFWHDLSPGKSGILGALSTSVNGVEHYGTTTVEFDQDGNLLNQWDISQIISNYMSANGDDPSLFVRDGIDWWHQNSQIYDPSDDSLILSSRENFVMKIDYLTGDIRWILGDTTKYWYTFASLRAKALDLTNGLAPVGQHSLTIAPDGSLLLFNDGFGSTNVPAGQSPGISRTYSAVSDYVIDEAAGKATNVWNYLHSPTYYSPICSSAKQMSDGSMLIDYAYTDNGTQVHLVGLDASRNVAFDYQMPTSPGCGVAWNAEPINFDSLNLQ